MTPTQAAVLTGITSQEAAQGLALAGPNELPTARKRNLAQHAWDVVSQPMLLGRLILTSFRFPTPWDAVLWPDGRVGATGDSYDRFAPESPTLIGHFASTRVSSALGYIAGGGHCAQHFGEDCAIC